MNIEFLSEEYINSLTLDELIVVNEWLEKELKN